MYTNVSDSFLNKIAQPSRHFAARFYDGATFLDLEIMHINITTGTCGGSTLAIGCAFAGYIEVTARYTDILLEGKELKLELGLLLDNGNYEYIPFGYWTVQKPSVSQDVMTFTAVDRVAAKLNEEYTSSLTYPATIASVLSELSTAAGVTINCSLQTTQQIPVAIEGVTQRGALAIIAGLLLGCAWADRSGAIQITAYGNSSTDVSVNYDYVKTAPPMDEKATEISGVKVYTVDGQTDTYITVGTAHMVEESNIYMTQTTLDAVANNVVGLEYNGGNVPFMGNPLIDPSDTITFNDGTNAYSVPCMEILHSFDGGLLTTVTAPGSFEATESTIHTGAISQELERMAKATSAAQETADDAMEAASAAATAASNANTLATSKGKIFFQSSAPSSGMQTNDMWMDTDGGNSLYQYNGSSWVLKQLGQGSIAAGSITAVELNVSNFTAGAGNVLNMTAGILTSSDWDFDYDTPGTIYATAGMRISLNDKYIRTPNFAVVGGNLYARNGTFSGSVTASSGNIGGYTVSSTANTGTTANGGHVYANSLYTHSNGTETVGTTETAYEYEAGIAGGGAYNNAAFYIKKMLNGGSWSSSEHVFYVRNDGYLYATRGSISGGIITTGISASNISTGTLTAIAINNGSGTFSVTSAGALTATNATITGAITATSGTIGGFSIENNYQIVYRDQMTAGTAGTQYAIFMRATDNGSAPTGSTAAFGVVHRGYDGTDYDSSWASDFIVRHNGEVYCYGGALHIENTSSSSHDGKIQFANAWIGSSASRSLALHATGDLDVYASDDVYISGDLVSITTGIDGTTGSPVGSIAIETASLGIIGNTTLRGTFQTSQNINVYNNSATSYAVGVQNSVGKVQLYMSSGGNMGIYDGTNSRWILYENTSGEIISPRVYSNTGSGSTVVVDSNGKVCRTSSSKRFKHDIKPLTEWKSILNIPVVSFKYNEGYVSKNDQRYDVSVPGFIAEDVDRYYPLAADKNKGTVEDWNIRYIVPPMLAVEQDHEKRIAELEHELSILKGERR